MPKRTEVRSRLTELEAVVLGVIGQDGPCTPYAIRRVFAESPAPRWSGSAGAIYPLIRRLEKRGLVASVEEPRGTRSRRSYRLTSTGKAKFRTWLRNPDETDSALPHDPWRSRLWFFRALSPTEAVRRLKQDAAAMRTRLERLRSDARNISPDKELWALMATRAAIGAMEARIRAADAARRQIAARRRK